MDAALNPVRQDRLRALLDLEAEKLGFDAVAVTTPDATPRAPERLAAYVERGRHATMDWMAETMARRGDPRVLWPEVRSVVMLAMNLDDLAAHYRFRENSRVAVQREMERRRDAATLSQVRWAESVAPRPSAPQPPPSPQPQNAPIGSS